MRRFGRIVLGPSYRRRTDDMTYTCLPLSTKHTLVSMILFHSQGTVNVVMEHLAITVIYDPIPEQSNVVMEHRWLAI